MNVSFRQYKDLLAKYLQSQSSQVGLLAALLASGLILNLVNPQVIRYFIDTAQSGGSQPRLLAAALLFLALALAARALSLATDVMAENVSWTATNALRSDLALHALQLDMSFHKMHTPGELIERIDDDTSHLANFFSQFVVRVLGNALLVLGILLLLFREDIRVGLGLGLYTVITLTALAALHNIAVKRWASERQADAEMYGFLEERISGAEDIRASAAEEYTLARLVRLMRRALQKYRAARLVSNLAYAITNFLFVIGYGLGLALGAYLYLQGQVTAGSAFLIVYYIGMLSGPIQAIREQVEDLQRAAASIERVGELFRTQPRVQYGASGHFSPPALPAGPLPVVFEQVSFLYNDGLLPAGAKQNKEDLVLQNVSFHLPAGKVLGLLGRTGSGKTTLSRLLFRLYDLTSGTIRLGELDLQDIPLQELRKKVGLVTQDVQLFQATLRDNLTFFDPHISDARLQQVLEDLLLWDWVLSLPAGLDTPLAAGGLGFSAGEAQLLAFTRVFLKNPGLVILDEASSRLDPATENLLEKAVDRLFQGRTGIVIAHRLQTVQRSDQVLILEGGRLLENGPRQSLAADPASHFYRLLQTGLEEALT